MAALLHRRDVVNTLLARRNADTLVIAGLGSSAWDVTAAGENDGNFPLIGAMGLAVPIGLGLATAQPDKRILVITGDGDMLMSLGALATVALVRPRNLAIIVLDNERFGETGGQPTHTASVTDLAAIAKGAGIETTDTIREDSAIEAMVAGVYDTPGPVFYVVKIAYETLEDFKPPLDGAYAKDRFRVALLGEKAAVGGA
jgi:thiamine pyrophosphate-dependent acetolactate synthase large subunit-like protein